MRTKDECIEILNQLLEEGQTEKDEKLFISVINDCKFHFQLKLVVLDFKFYNEERLVEAQEKKVKAVHDQDFEFAAKCREAENTSIKLIEMKTNQNIVKSEFKLEDNNLVLYFLGKTDIEVRARKTLDFAWNILF